MPIETLISQESKSVVEQLDMLFAPWNRTDSPGLIVGIVKDGATIYRRGFGMASLETFVANSPTTRMRIASMTKQFTSVLALLLVEEGKLDLDAPIRTYLPEMTGPGGDPTLRLLLQHRGGSRCFLDLGTLARGMTPPPIGSALATQVRQTGRNFAPGDAMLYNNGGYHLVSIAIERVGDGSFEAQLKNRIFDPLGMVDTASIPTDYEITPGLATNHTALPGGRWRRGLHQSEESKGSGAMVSTVDDMLRWTAHLQSRQILGSSKLWSMLLERPVFPDGTIGHYALGLMHHTYRGVRTLHHGGAWNGASSQMLTLPDHGLDVVILANGAPGAKPAELAERVVDIVLAERLHEPTPTVVAANYESLLGDWWSPETEMLYSLIDEAGTLKLQLCRNPLSLLLERRPDGSVVSHATTVGEVEIGLDDALKSGDLTIRFGGCAANYRKLSPPTPDPTGFAQAVSGEYHSHDADCSATVVHDSDRLAITFAEPYGRTEWILHPLSESVAHIEGTLLPAPRNAAITLTVDDGRVTGFHLNTIRTRNLVFNRLEHI